STSSSLETQMPKIWLIPALVLALLTGGALSGGAALAQGNAPTVSPDDRILGKPDAPITIVEYASLTCPHCAAFERDTLPKLKTQYIDTGKVKLIYRDFPLDSRATLAAMIARCAPRDRYFGFVDAFFRSQDQWARSEDPVRSL